MPAMPGETRPVGRAADLLDAAARRFVAVGIRKTTMEDIAREAGAGKATLYRYFPNRAAVVSGLIARESERFERALRAATDEAVTAAGQVEAAFAAAVAFLRTHQLLTKGLAEEPEALLPYLTLPSGPVLRACLRVFAELVDAGIASGEFRAVRREWAAETLCRLLVSFATLPTIVVDADAPDQVRAYARDLLAGGLVGSDGARALHAAPARAGSDTREVDTVVSHDMRDAYRYRPEPAEEAAGRSAQVHERDRDEEGRPANARPRDRFGRPLPRGARDEMAHAEEPETVVSTLDEAFARAVALFDEQRFFEAHEFFEHIWKSAWVAAGDREFWKGVTQTAVGCCHVQRGNERGAVTLLERAAGYLRPYPEHYHGVDTAALAEGARAVAAQVRAHGASPDRRFFRFPRAR